MAGINDEKNTAVASIETRASSTSSAATDASHPPPGKPLKPGRRWLPTLLHFGPLSGIFCLLLALACIIASLGLLTASDGESVQKWGTPISTWLAVFTAIANLSIRYATFQGAVIFWWLKACNGTSLRRLHWEWRSGTSLRGALASGRNLGLLGFACICSTFVMIDGPLLQRASTIVSAQYVDRTVPLNISMAMEIPTGFTGFWELPRQAGLAGLHWFPGFNETLPAPHGTVSNNIIAVQGGTAASSNISEVSRGWISGHPIRDVVVGCPGTCHAQIVAPALYESACATRSFPVDYYALPVVADASVGDTAPPLEAFAFAINSALVVDENETINLITGNAVLDDECNGEFTYTVCTLESAIGLYDIDIVDNAISTQNLSAPSIIAVANNTAVNHTLISGHRHPSTLAGIPGLMVDKMSQFGYASKVEGGSIEMYSLGKAPAACPAWSNPRDVVMQSVNALTLYIGAVAAQADESYLKANMDPGLPVKTTVTGYVSGDHNVFKTTYWYFLAAALIEVICVAAIVPTYWNFWKLGRPVSFSPLEVAKAFRAPMLSDCYSNSTGAEIAECIGSNVIRYGGIHDGPKDEETLLAFAEPSAIEVPQKGIAFDQ